jgi:hypothetical protein
VELLAKILSDGLVAKCVYGLSHVLRDLFGIPEEAPE